MSLRRWIYENAFRFPKWVQDWIVPGYAWSNMLHRTDIVRLPGKMTEYHEYDWRMMTAIFTLVVDFVEEEERNHIVDWEGTGKDALEAWNSMKKIRNWWKSGRKRAISRWQRFLDFYHKWYVGEPDFSGPDENGMVSMTFTTGTLPKTFNEFEIALSNDDWDVVDEFFSDRRKIADKKAVKKLARELENFVYEQDTKYLKLAVDVRGRMWT